MQFVGAPSVHWWDHLSPRPALDRQPERSLLQYSLQRCAHTGRLHQRGVNNARLQEQLANDLRSPRRIGHISQPKQDGGKGASTLATRKSVVSSAPLGIASSGLSLLVFRISVERCRALIEPRRRELQNFNVDVGVCKHVRVYQINVWVWITAWILGQAFESLRLWKSHARALVPSSVGCRFISQGALWRVSILLKTSTKLPAICLYHGVAVHRHGQRPHAHQLPNGRVADHVQELIMFAV